MKKVTMGTSTAYNTPAKIAARSKMKKNIEGGRGKKSNTEGGTGKYISSSKPSAGKSNPKAAVKGKGSLPKSATMKSRGSNSAKQVGDQNQREFYNGQRIPAGSRTGYYMGYNSKRSSTKNNYTPNQLDTTKTGQRAGGSKNLSEMEKKAKANAKRVSNKPKAPLKSVKPMRNAKPKASRGR